MIKKGDKVIVMAGKDKKKSGTVTRVFPKLDKAIVEGINIRKRHLRPRKSGQKGTIKDMEAAIHISNLKKDEGNK
jgi:large subunit ribosomal protein L24